MIDVHAPEHPIHGVREFLIHLFTITVGLLIALGLENMVEWRHHVHLKHQAEETMRQEIRANQKDLQEVVAAVPREQESLRQIETFLQARVAGKTPEVHSLQTGMVQATPQNAAWQTAAATGALSFMDYDEVQRFSSAYELQAKFERFEDAALPPILGIMASLATTDKPETLTPTQAEDALKEVHLAMAHLYATKGLANDVNKTYNEALKENK
jgi:hypothetical protein